MRSLFLALALSSLPLGAQVVPAQEGNRGEPAQQEAAKASETASPESRPSADDRIADYTWWLTLFTGVLTFVGIFTARLSYRQDQMISRQFVSTFRPRLRVRQVGRVEEFDYEVVEFTVVNEGGSVARIVESRATLLVFAGSSGHDQLPHRPFDAPDAADARIYHELSYALARRPLSEWPFAAGEARKLRWHSTTLDEKLAELDLWVSARVYFLGYVLYEDDNGVRRRTGFCRVAQPKQARLVNLEKPDPDYEYAD